MEDFRVGAHPSEPGAAPIAGSGTVTPADYREAMSRVAGHVHVVTTDGPAGRAGFTATAVMSVSDDPATLVVCLNGISQSVPVFRANGVLAVNALGARDEPVARAFAGQTGIKGEARFAVGTWSADDTAGTASPVLDTAPAVFLCRIVEARRIATHFVFLAEVAALRLGPVGAPLIWHARTYGSLPTA